MTHSDPVAVILCEIAIAAEYGQDLDAVSLATIQQAVDQLWVAHHQWRGHTSPAVTHTNGELDQPWAAYRNAQVALP